MVSNGVDVYQVSPGGMTHKQELYGCSGSGSLYISGFLKDKIQPDMNFYETREVAVKALALAIVHDGSSGGNMRIVDLKANGTTTEEILLHSEIRRVLNGA